MSSIKSFAFTFVLLAVIFGQMTFITPIPMPPAANSAPGLLLDNSNSNNYVASLPFNNPPPTIGDQQQLLNYLRNVYRNSRYYYQQPPQEDPRPIQAYLAYLVERLQSLEEQQQDRNLIADALANDVTDNDDYFLNNTAKRSWDKMGGLWGKRMAGGGSGGDNWNKFRGT